MSRTPATLALLDRVRETLDKIDEEDISLGTYRVLEAMYACVEAVMYLGLAQGVNVMSVDDLMKGMKDTKSSKDVPATDATKVEQQINSPYL